MKHVVPLALVSIFLFSHICSAAPRPESFAYVLQADSFAASKAQAVERLTACSRDWIVLDTSFSSEIPWERNDLDKLREGRAGRKILAYISIGEAEDYRGYWRKEWGGNGKLTSVAPKWLGTENPDWKGNYRVKYWHPEWQKLMLDAVDEVMAHGFDGVYLDIVDGFQTFEQDGSRYIDDRLNPETEQTYRRDMVEWVKAIAARVRSNNPEALVVPQNGSQLLAQADFVTAINAIGLEDLFTEGDKLQSKSHTTEVLGYLKSMTAEQKPVLLIEYPKSSKRQALAKKLAQENGMIWLITDRELKTLGQAPTDARQHESQDKK